MEYKHLSNERKEYIDNLAEKLRQDYCSNSKIDFQRIAEDNDITLVKTTKIMAELAVRTNGKNYVFIGNMAIPSVKKFATAHGLGHRILNHTSDIPVDIKEDEANYFAEKLTDIKNNKKYGKLSDIEAIFDVLMHPIKCSRYVHHAGEDAIKLITRLEAKAQEEK